MWLLIGGFIAVALFTSAAVHAVDKGEIKDGIVTTKSGLKYKDLKVGAGAQAQDGKKVTVHYVGKFMDGKQFDSSRGKGPFEVTLGTGSVIKGWEEGLVGVKAGGKRLLIIPPELAYGKTGSGRIPPNATLYFEIEVLKVE